MKVTVCSHKDYANYGYLNAKAMRSVGIDATAYVLKDHPFAYPERSIKTSLDHIKAEANDSDVVIVMHSCGTMETIMKHIKKPVIVFHTGTRYRINRKKYDDLWKPIANKVVVALLEFYQQGVDYVSVTMDDTKLQPDFTARGKRFGHYPSNSHVKGTSTIQKAVREAGAVIDVNTRNVPYMNNILRIKNVDAYVELFSDQNRGFDYGSFGTTAVEAAMLGKAVITHNKHLELYNQLYQPNVMPFFVKEYSQLVDVIRWMNNMDEKELMEAKMNCYQWAVENHSLEATGKRMLNVIQGL